MPRAPRLPCRNARRGCAALVDGGGYCPACKPAADAARERAIAARRGSSSARGYDTRHATIAARVRREEPLCKRCEARGIIRPTDVADHIVPVRYGGKNERSNYQGLCYACNTQKAVEDQARYER